MPCDRDAPSLGEMGRERQVTYANAGPRYYSSTGEEGPVAGLAPCRFVKPLPQFVTLRRFVKCGILAAMSAEDVQTLMTAQEAGNRVWLAPVYDAFMAEQVSG